MEHLHSAGLAYCAYCVARAAAAVAAASRGFLPTALFPPPPPPGAPTAISTHKRRVMVLPRRLLPPRVREVVGVMHMKAFVFDDSLLLSGANLSNSYFTNRQVRERGWRWA